MENIESGSHFWNILKSFWPACFVPHMKFATSALFLSDPSPQ